MNDAWEPRERSYPTKEEVRAIIALIIKNIESSGPPQVAPEWSKPRKLIEIPERPPITYSQQEIDAAKAMARKELDSLGVDSIAYSDKPLQSNDVGAKAPPTLPQEDLPL